MLVSGSFLWCLRLETLEFQHVQLHILVASSEKPYINFPHLSGCKSWHAACNFFSNDLEIHPKQQNIQASHEKTRPYFLLY